MPHSSGGGSHGGGSRSSHSTGGSHGGGSSYIRSSRNFSGAHRYVYYRKRRPVYYYTNAPESVEKNYNSRSSFLFVLFYIPFIYIAIAALTTSVSVPKKITVDYNNRIVINDEAGIFENTDALESTLHEFRDKTGISPAIITVNNEDWQDYYSSLENYAYELYVTNFEDEYHWLIVYSEPEMPDEDFNDWYWEGMQGDNTDNILTADVTDKFNTLLQKNLLKRSKYNVEDAVAQAFTDSMGSFMRINVNLKNILSAVFVFAFIGIHAAVSIGYTLNRIRRRNAKLVPDGMELKEIRCAYCGGIYLYGTCTECPHCGAPLIN